MALSDREKIIIKSRKLNDKSGVTLDKLGQMYEVLAKKEFVKLKQEHLAKLKKSIL